MFIRACMKPLPKSYPNIQQALNTLQMLAMSTASSPHYININLRRLPCPFSQRICHDAIKVVAYACITQK